MADSLEKREQELKNIEKQAEATTEAIKKLTEEELKAQMIAALDRAKAGAYTEYKNTIENTTNAIKTEVKAVENISNKIKMLDEQPVRRNYKEVINDFRQLREEVRAFNTTGITNSDELVVYKSRLEDIRKEYVSMNGIKKKDANLNMMDKLTNEVNNKIKNTQSNALAQFENTNKEKLNKILSDGFNLGFGNKALDYLKEQRKELDESSKAAKKLNEIIAEMQNKLDALNTNNITQSFNGFVNSTTQDVNAILNEMQKVAQFNIENGNNQTLYGQSTDIDVGLYTQNDIIDASKKAHVEMAETAVQAFNNMSIVVSTVCRVIKTAINGVISVIKTWHNFVKSSINAVINIFKKLGSIVERIIQIFGNLANRVGLLNNNGNILKGTFTELRNKVAVLTTAFKKLYDNEFIKRGEALLSSVQTMNIVMGSELTQNTIEWTKELERGFGLSAAGLTSQLKGIVAVLKGLGMASNDIEIAGKNMLTIGVTLSAITGYDIDTVLGKIESGLKGMVTSIDDLGLSVRETQMNKFLKDLKAQGGEYANISTSFSALNEQQRIYVRTAAITQQFLDTGFLEKYTKSLDTVTGRLTIFKSRLNSLMSTLGTFALRLFDLVVKPLSYTITMIEAAIKRLAAFFGFDLDLSAGMNDNKADEIIGDNEDISESLDNVKDSADKAKASLDAFDHISSISTGSVKGSNAGDAFDYSSLLKNEKYDLGGILEEISKMQDDWLKSANEAFKRFIDKIALYIFTKYKQITGRLGNLFKIGDLVEGLKNLKKALDIIKDAFANLGRAIKNVFETIFGLGASFLDDIDWTTIVIHIAKVIEKFTKLVEVITGRLKPELLAFYERVIKPLTGGFSEFIHKGLDRTLAKLDEWIAWWEDPANSETIQGWFDKITKYVKLCIIFVKEILGKNTLDDTIWFNDNAGDGFKNIRDSAKSLKIILSSLLEILGGLVTHILDFNGDGKLSFDDLLIALRNIKKTLLGVKDWFNENKEPITKLLSEAYDTIKKITEADFTVIKDVIQFIVNNSELVCGFLNVVQGVLDFIIAHPVISTVIVFGLNIGGQVIKTAITAAIWKNILGVGTGGALSSAVNTAGTTIATIGTKLTTAIKTGVTSGISYIQGLSINWAGVPWIIALGIALKEVYKSFEDHIIGENGSKIANTFDFDTLDNGTLQEQADEYYKILRKHFGTEIPRDVINFCLEEARKNLEASNKYTEQQVERMVSIIEQDLYGDIEQRFNNVFNQGSLSNLIEEAHVVDTYVEGISDSIYNNINSASDSVNASSLEMITSIDNTSDSIKSLDDIIAETSTNTVRNVDTMTTYISKSLNTLRDTISTLRDLSHAQKDITTNWGGTVSGTTKWSPVKVNGIRGFANGGIPNSGSLFFANENGNMELVGNFGGYSGVANNSMIINAMQGAIGNSMYDAVNSALKNNAVASSGNTYDICRGGMFVGDESSIRKLANMINNVNISSRATIANTGFSI